MRGATLLHVGMPKTGTTSLQMNLFIRHPEMHYLGKPLTVFSKPIARLTRGITYDPALDTPTELAAFEAEVVRPLIREARGPIVISEEEFATSTPTSTVSPDRIADRLAALFGDARILITVRSQAPAIRSLYRHMVRMGFSDGDSLEQWFEVNFDIAAHQSLFDYETIYQRYASRFGAERVHVLPFEWLRDDPERFVRSVSALADVDGDVGWAEWGTDTHRNASEGTVVSLNAAQRARIADRYRSSNRSLSAHTGLNLEALNYAV
jgi:hypothetical protein